MEDRPYLSYAFRSPRMDQSVPPNQVKPGSFGRLSGVDGRFSGGLRKYYGNREVLDLDDVTGMGDIDTYAGPSYFKYVTFQKRNTSTIYRGFVVRWDSQDSATNQQIDLVYTLDNGSNWIRLPIWTAGKSITSSLEISCVVDRGYLMVAVDTKATKTVYWNGSSLVAVDSGPGNFDTELEAMTLSTSAVDTSYQLHGEGVYQVAYRFYSSSRGIYSGLSAPLTIHLDHIKTTKAVGTISFSSVEGDSGLMVAGDVITINSRTYEYIDSGSEVTIPAAAGATIAQHATVLADTINGDSGADVTASAQATSVLLEAKVRGTGGNAYDLSVSEVNPNQGDISVTGATLSGGGVVTTDPETQVKATIDFPAHASVVASEDFDDFNALFDTVDVFRTINLGKSFSGQGAIFYLEQTIIKAGNWATSGTWDSLQVSIGTILDTALPALTFYDPEKDIIASPPQSGTIGRYEGLTFMAQASSVDGGYDTLWSSAEHISPEYFSTYNRRVADAEDGRPLQFISAADSLFQLSYNAITLIFKSGKLKPIQFSRLHKKRGPVGKEVAHSSGNSIFMISGLGLIALNAKDGSMGGISTADRVIFDDWKASVSDVKSCYDAKMNASFFLNPTAEETMVLWHSTHVCTMLDGTNFVGATSGPDIVNGKNDRAFFVTATGLIVSPDHLKAGSGSMWDLSSSYTLNGTTTVASATTLTDAGATLNDDMVGAKLYFVTGDNAGIGRTIDTIDNTAYDVELETGKEITFTVEFPNPIAVGDTYAISPVPFSLRAWPVQAEQVSRFNRWDVVGIALKCRALSGFSGIPNDKWRVGAYRNSGTSIESPVAYPSVDSNPAASAEVFKESDEPTAIDGVDIELYIEQIAVGVSFELTDAEIALALTDSRKVL